MGLFMVKERHYAVPKARVVDRKILNAKLKPDDPNAGTTFAYLPHDGTSDAPKVVIAPEQA